MESSWKIEHCLLRLLSPFFRFAFPLLFVCFSYLKPNFDLSFGEIEMGGHFYAPRPTEVAIVVEFLFELHQLGTRVGRPCPFRRMITSVWN